MTHSSALHAPHRWPPGPASRPLSGLLIVALHAALGWALWLDPLPRTEPPSPAPLTVALLPSPGARQADVPAAELPRPTRAILPVRLLSIPTVPRLAEPAAQRPAVPSTTPPAHAAPAEAASAPARPMLPAPAKDAVDTTESTSPPPVIPPSAIRFRVPPAIVYPGASRRLAEAGLVMVAVLVDEDGLPREVRVVQSSGFERLDRAAVDGVRHARFDPYLRDGQPTPGWVRIPIPFELQR